MLERNGILCYYKRAWGDLRNMFYEVANLYKNFSFSLTTDETWKRFEEALTEYDVMVTAKKIDAGKYINNNQELP